MALISLLPEAACSLLVNQLDKTKRLLEAVGKNNLDIALVYCRIRLEKELQEKVLMEVLGGIQGMNPSALTCGIRS